jgi:hypothetical protein
MTASEEGEKAAGLAAATRDAAMKDAKAAEERCRATEAKLSTLHDEQAAEARQRKVQEEELKAQKAAVADRDAELERAAREQATERGRLEKLKEEVEAEKAQLETREKLLAKDEEAAAAGRAAFDSLEQRSRKALQDLYGSELKEPLVTSEEGPAELLPKLVMALEGVVIGFGPMVEGEARALSTSAVTRVFYHLRLPDPNFDLGAMLEPVDPDCYNAIAEAVKGQVEALLQKFLAIDPATTAGGTGDGDVVDDGTPQAGDGGAQG